MTEARIVPVKTWLTPTAYRALEQIGRAQHFGDVGATLSVLADRVATPPRPKQQYTRITAAMITDTRRRMAEGETLSAIATEYGASRTGLRKALTRREAR